MLERVLKKFSCVQVLTHVLNPAQDISPLDLLNQMAVTPDVYFSDMWDDANMGEALQYLLKRDRTWSPVGERAVSLVPWEICIYDRRTPLISWDLRSLPWNCGIGVHIWRTFAKKMQKASKFELFMGAEQWQKNTESGGKRRPLCPDLEFKVFEWNLRTCAIVARRNSALPHFPHVCNCFLECNHFDRAQLSCTRSQPSMSLDTLKAAQSFLHDQVTQVKSEHDLEEMIEAGTNDCQ